MVEKETKPQLVTEYIERPLFQEVVKVEKEIHKEPIVNTIMKETHIPVEISKPCVVSQEYPVEVPTTVNHYVTEEKPVFIKE